MRTGYGTDPHKLYTSDSPETSVEAAHAVDTPKLEKIVHEAIISFGSEGAIADDLLTQFYGYPYSSITARFAALERKGFIYRNGEKKKGRSGRNQMIMRDICHKVDDA